jgi:uncharacterized repeat protein (TIGR01451 family)
MILNRIQPIRFAAALVTFIGGVAALSAQPTIGISFNPTNVVIGQTSTLIFTINNPSGSAITNVAVSDTFPANLFIQNPNGLTGGCGAGVITAAPATGTVTLSGGNIAANSSCVFSVSAIVLHQTSASVIYTNTTGNVSASSGTGNTGTATLTAGTGTFATAKGFGPTAINTGQVSTLTFTLTCAQPNGAFVGQCADVTLQDTLPSGLVVATPNGLSVGTCGGNGNTPVITATAGSSLIQLGNAVVQGGGSGGVSLTQSGGAFDTCTFSVNVTANFAGTFTNTIGPQGGGASLIIGSSGSANGSATLVATAVAVAPTFSKAFGAASILLNATTSLTFTIQNTGSVPLTGVAFTDTLPPGMTAVNGSSSQCGGTLNVTGTNNIALSGATVAATSTCTFAVTVTATTVGVKSNTAGPISTNETGTGSPTTAIITVIGPPGLSKSFGSPSIAAFQTVPLNFTITNPNSTPISGIAFTDSLPDGLIATASSTSQCNGTLTVTTNSIALSGAVVSSGSPCTFSVTITTVTGGVKNNVTSTVTSSNAGTGAAASASLTVTLPPNGVPGPSSWLLLLTALPAMYWFGRRALRGRGVQS